MAIGYVVVQSWFGAVCPLTTLEMTLRHRAGQVTYDETFIAHWVGKLVYYEAEPWVFVVDSTGLVAGRFEGLVTPEELQTLLG